MYRPPTPPAFAEAMTCGNVAFTVLKEPSTSMSITALKAFGDNDRIGARKFPAAPAITKSIRPSSLTHCSTADCRFAELLTSTFPMPRTLAPDLTVAMSSAFALAFSSFRPTMQASAPRWTRARTCALHMLPEPPVQKTTLPSSNRSQEENSWRCRLPSCLPNILSFHTSLTYPDFDDAIAA